MTALPSSLALTSIADGSQIIAAAHRNNYTSVQTAVNALISALAAGTSGQLLSSSGSTAVAYVDAPLLTGWTATSATLTYSSADAPTFVATTSLDLTAVIPVGAKIKLTQTTAKYFIVTAIDATTITLYGGTDYTLANAAITLPFYSLARSPVGFPLSPLKWTVETRDIVTRTQATPVAGTWYNPNATSISVPIGCWSLEYEANLYFDDNSTVGEVLATLSTANNSESDVDFTTYARVVAAGATNMTTGTPSFRKKHLLLAAKTSYYINVKTGQAGVVTIGLDGGTSPTIIRAVCAYL